MDQGSFRSADQRQSNRSPVRLDYGVLIATLGAVQTSGLYCPTASSDSAPKKDPLVELLTGGPRWRDAIPLQAGSFNRNLYVMRRTSP